MIIEYQKNIISKEVNRIDNMKHHPLPTVYKALVYAVSKVSHNVIYDETLNSTFEIILEVDG